MRKPKESRGNSPVQRERLRTPGFDLSLTLNSGQVFHWLEYEQGLFCGTIGEEAVWLRQEGDHLAFGGTTADRVIHYLGLDHPVGSIFKSFPPSDRTLRALDQFGGLRIIRQPAWEALATFLTATVKRVEHIRQMNLALRERFGRPGTASGHRVYTFPTPEVLRDVGEHELRGCGLGFRAPRLLRLAERIADGEINLGDWTLLGDRPLFERLLSVDGIGTKVADCVMLFGFGRLGAFPVDTWIQRVLRWEFGGAVPKNDLRELAMKHFGNYGGYAQQILFHAARTGFISGDAIDGN